MIIDRLHKISNQYASKWLILLLDVMIVTGTLIFAYLIRFNFQFDFDINSVFMQMPIVAFTATISFFIVKIHHGVVRYTGLKDIVNVVIGANILATSLLLFTWISRKTSFFNDVQFSGSVIYIHLFLNIISLLGFKFFIRSLYRHLKANKKNHNAVMIYGAGDSGLITYDALTNDTQKKVEIIGFIDDNPNKVGKKINQITVYSLDKINSLLVEKHELKEVIISIQNIDPTRLLQITTTLFNLGLKVKIIPPVSNWIDGDLNVGQIKDVKIEDLLGREPISIANHILDEEYNNQIILITGAAGSIGSEISRKLSKFNYKKLILIDVAESALYDLQQEFIIKGLENFEVVVADVRDADRIAHIFETYKPKIVFHAAAYKHVPLMENSPYEAVQVNVRGTKNIADFSIKHGIQKFVLISTDKAVNPTNVMGATKRAAEMYVNSLKGQGETRFITTRFGNVLGSNGSVIPLFKKQIEAGGPLTVTHKDITRYFMTISEASLLVLEAAAMGSGGEIFVFDMGKSVKIFELAKNMIFLSGFAYPDDIDIKITGLRPGEKIYEELLADGENTKPTYHEKIMIAKTIKVDAEKIIPLIERLCLVQSNSQNLTIVSIIKSLIPEYISNNSKYEVLDSIKK